MPKTYTEEFVGQIQTDLGLANMRIIDLIEEIKGLNSRIEQLKRQVHAEKERAEANADTAVMLCERAGVSADEAAQLGLAIVIKNDAGEVLGFQKRTIEDALADDNLRGGEVKFRQLKDHFRNYQNATAEILKQIDSIGKQNIIRPENFNQLMGVREELSALMGRQF